MSGAAPGRHRRITDRRCHRRRGAAARLEDSFEIIVPFLVAIAALALLCQPRCAGSPRTRIGWLFFLGMLAISVYGGYFGAGAGIMVLALMLIVTSEPLWKAALSKSLFLGISNTVAAVAFMIWGPVDWWAALAMGIGCFAGGWCGPPVVKRGCPNARCASPSASAACSWPSGSLSAEVCGCGRVRQDPAAPRRVWCTHRSVTDIARRRGHYFTAKLTLSSSFHRTTSSRVSLT